MKFIPIFFLLAGCGSPWVPNQYYNQALSVLMANNPNPISLSPSGTHLLSKEMLPDSFRLVVTDLKTGATVFSHESHDSQLAPAWSPDGSKIAYMSDHDGDQQFYPFIIDIASEQVTMMKVPYTTSANLQWSPDGTQIAYIQKEWGQNKINRLMAFEPIREGEGARLVTEFLTRKSGFAWSHAGELASVTYGDRGDEIVIVKEGHKRVIQFFGQVKTLSFSPNDEHIIITGRSKKDEYFSVYEIGDQTKRVISQVGDIQAASYIDGGILYHWNYDGEVSIWRRSGGKDQLISIPSGRAILTNVIHNEAIILQTSRTTPPSLYGVNLGSLKIRSIKKAHEVNNGTVKAESIRIPTEWGEIPAYLWRTQKKGAPLLIRVHGGPDTQSYRSWDGLSQLCFDNNIDVLSINYRGSTGYGVKFEEGINWLGVSNNPAGQDILSALDYAQYNLKYSRDRIFMQGHSYGSQVIIEAILGESARNQRLPFAGAILLSPIGFGEYSDWTRVPILTYQGENDISLPIKRDGSALELSTFLKRHWFFPGTTVKSVTIKNEGHSFSRLNNNARVYSDMVEFIKNKGEI